MPGVRLLAGGEGCGGGDGSRSIANGFVPGRHAWGGFIRAWRR
ncbi:hypothetical protein AvCA_43680 [Azotobacter vinelandii CA]|uniref:Uncharacterized protein n=2 Tax=Azotobacter vinelandii TaxID=354 RepID=C1DGJ3_AZOVD|nr:hypothetical protein Avin_43680 [Azotobacter vinelandii DJ]AGK15979.1 hypothetical protein AvCA_43680 [Azotobacter vinelandii CA]AGK21947.1 hypothetical protein AvCA6_43680 [Azotobacter vinelandii CA6]